MELLGTFAIFQIENDIPDSNFIDIAPAIFTPEYLAKNATPNSSKINSYKLFDKVKIVTNSMILSFDKLFRNVSHSTMIN